MHATSLPFGTVNSPGDRYHPTIIATLNVMFPGRYPKALGSSEAINEHDQGNT